MVTCGSMQIGTFGNKSSRHSTPLVASVGCKFDVITAGIAYYNFHKKSKCVKTNAMKVKNSSRVLTAIHALLSYKNKVKKQKLP